MIPLLLRCYIAPNTQRASLCALMGSRENKARPALLHGQRQCDIGKIFIEKRSDIKKLSMQKRDGLFSPLVSESFLQCRNGKGLHYRPCWLGLHHYNLAKHFSFSCLCCGFLTSLYHANSWQHNFACTL